MKVFGLLVFVLLFQFGASIRETINKKITVAAPPSSCNKFPQPLQSPACASTYGASKLGIERIPPDWQCPCPVSGSNGGQITAPQGTPAASNPDSGFFQDYVVANGFINPIGVSFADDGFTMFVGTRDGVIWHVNLNTGVKTMFYDISPEVGFSGDRGLMDVRAHPNYANVRQMLIMYVVDDTPNDGFEPHSESSQQQRIIRVSDADLDGVRDAAGIKLNIIGGKNTIPYDDGVAICFNTHAVGSIQFGWDASFFVSTGEGAHWNFDMGDWGQDTQIVTLDQYCRINHGPEQDVGAFRSQIANSLSGKILRITPDTGVGICSGPAAGNGYPVKNPLCVLPSDDGSSRKSKIWSFGARNPFRMTVRPPLPGEANGYPGVPYFGDVGQGGWEEINAVIQPNMNFGWPCWEGPMPSPIYRDSQYNLNVNYNYTIGCKGDGGIDGPCKPIETIAYDMNGIRWTCPHMYYNYTTILPFFFYSRFLNFDTAGYFGEIGYTGQGFIGSAIGGLTFYRGTNYPTRFQGQLFILDFPEKWIRVLYQNSDVYESAEDFTDLIFTPPLDGAKVTLESHSNGDICYVTMNGGEIRCFKYVVTNVAPSVSCSAVETLFRNVPFTVQFLADGTFDRENDQIILEWNFGDGTAVSNVPNPTHQYTSAGPFNAVLKVTDQVGNVNNCSVTVKGGNSRPVVAINSPVATITNPQKVYEVSNPNLQVTFSALVTDDDPSNSWSWEWEVALVHNNHIHNRVVVVNTPSWNITAGLIPNEGSIERNNGLVFCRVTDPSGATGTDFIRVSPSNWQTLFNGNAAPVANFTISSSFFPLQVGQPVRFDGTKTVDANGDRIEYLWTWGDSTGTGLGSTNTHIYNTAGTYTVTLVASDNWGAFTSTSLQLVIGAATATRPSVAPTSGKKFGSQTVSMSTISPGGTIRYTLDGSNPTTGSTAYTAPFASPFTPYTNLTIKAATFAPGLLSSAVSSVTYNFFPPPCTVLAIKQGCSLSCVNTQNPLPAGGFEYLPASSLGPGNVPTPDKMARYLISNVTATYDPSKNATRLKLRVDATGGGALVQARASYDFENDGVWDRIELFNVFAPNDVVGEYEEYQNPTAWQFNQRYHPPIGSVVGSYRNMVGGTFQLEVWQATNGISVRIALATGDALNGIQSTIELPYDDDSSFKVGPEYCLKCPGPLIADVCLVCGGPGLTGCDRQCFSTKVNDSCGTCGGPGPVGCDSQCFSTKTVDTCGVCGGLQTNCTIPTGTFPANELTIRGTPCNDLIPETGNGVTFRNTSLPDPYPTVLSVAAGIPTNPANYVKFSVRNITGFYNIDRKVTYLELWVDSLSIAGQQLGVAIEYDFDGNNVIDRTEVFQSFPPNDLPGWEKMVRYAQTNVPNAQGLQLLTGGNYQNFIQGNLHLYAWIAGQGTIHGPIYIRSDGGIPYFQLNSGVSYIQIPYITSYWYNFQTGGACGAISQVRNQTFTTAQQTTEIATTSIFTTAQQTTAQQTTAIQTTGVPIVTTAEQTTNLVFTTVEETTAAVVVDVTTGSLVTGSQTVAASSHLVASLLFSAFLLLVVLVL